MKKFLATWQANLWDAIRATGEVTSDGATICAEAAETCLLNSLTNEPEAIELIEHLNIILNSFDEEGVYKHMAKASDKKNRRTSIKRLRAAVATLAEVSAHNRILTIRKELEELEGSMQSMRYSNSRGLLEDSAFKKSELLHKRRGDNLKKERTVLYENFPALRDMSKAD